MFAAAPATEDRLSVLVAEDDPVSRLLIQGAVERLGHACVTAPNGERAWARFREQATDVVITDWDMPGLDGARLTALVREFGPAAYTYVIVLSGVAGEGTAREVMLAGADDLLAKPLEPAQLERKLIAAARMRAMHLRLRERAREEAPVLPDADGLAEELRGLAAPGARLALLALEGWGPADFAEAVEALGAARPGAPLYAVGTGRLATLLPASEAALAAQELDRLCAALPVPDGAGVLAGLAEVDDLRRAAGELLADAEAALAPPGRGDGRLRVVVADDDPIARTLLRALVEHEPSLAFSGAAEDAKGALELVRRERPDVVLMDYDMPGGGARAADDIRTEHKRTRVVAMSADDGPAAMMAMAHAGSVGYLVKGAPADEIVRAIHSAARW